MTSTADLPKTFGGYRLTILRNDDLLYPSAFQWHVILRSSTAHSIILSRDNALIYQRKFFPRTIKTRHPIRQKIQLLILKNGLINVQFCDFALCGGRVGGMGTCGKIIANSI
jgi:hypothetical protein